MSTSIIFCTWTGWVDKNIYIVQNGNLVNGAWITTINGTSGSWGNITHGKSGSYYKIMSAWGTGNVSSYHQINFKLGKVWSSATSVVDYSKLAMMWIDGKVSVSESTAEWNVWVYLTNGTYSYQGRDRGTTNEDADTMSKVKLPSAGNWSTTTKTDSFLYVICSTKWDTITCNIKNLWFNP